MAREQRRLAAIIAADVVGYSRLMGRDESGTLVRLRAHRRERIEPALARHGGRLVKLTGDGVLAEFPSAVEALCAAIGIQQAMADANHGQPAADAIVFRIGLHLGDLIVDGDDLYGDGVNVAARLEAEAPAGGILISRNVHDAVAGRLKATFHDLGELTLKNIERPMPAFRVQWNAVDWPSEERPLALPSATVAIARQDESLALPDRPSIAVLPFANMSGDPEQAYFADGVSEDIITELSRFHELFVIARNSSFSYKGSSVDVRTVARELGVRYVLEGSVRKAGNRVRVTGQLIDATSGSHIWAERYDRVLEDIFAVQEELTQSIVRAIAPYIRDIEVARVRRRPGSLSAYEIAVRADAKGREAYVKFDRALCQEAIADAHAALAIDPDSVLALDALASLHWRHLMLGTPDRGTTLREGLAAARRSIEVDREGNLGHTWKATFLAFLPPEELTDELLAEAHASARRANELNPHDSMSLIVLAFVEINVGEPESAIGHLQQALRVSPRDPLRHMMLHQLARACLCTRQYADGVAYSLACIGEVPGLPLGHALLTVNYIGLGEIEKGAMAFEQVRRVSPEYAKRFLTGVGMGDYRNPVYLRRRIVFARVAAGLEDPGAAEAVR